jgi:hypothetical protein
MKIKYDDNGDARIDVGLTAFAIFIGTVMVISFFSSPIMTGTKEGDRAPNIIGKAYNGNGWQNFDLSTYYDFEWSLENNNTTDSQWVMIEFLDTDCPYCFSSTAEYEQASQYFASDNPESPWNGPHVSFIASAAELTGLNGHESSREEIMAFRDKTPGEMCNSGNVDCSDREGGPFKIPFIDDLDKSHMNKWGIGGTPTYFLIQPDGIIAWSSFDHQDEKFYDAINRIVLLEYMDELHPQNDTEGAE